MKGAYTQLEVTPECQEYLTMNTFKGLFVYTRLPFGVKPAASIFQSVMDRVFLEFEQVHCYIDDILIGDATVEALKIKLIRVLEQLKNSILR
jgi:Reverse transcriptase (RNA-dependent DNA polymerase)